MSVSKSAANYPIQIVKQDVQIRLSSGYTRNIASGSRWRGVGSLPQGTVMKPVGTVFTIEGSQVHEAYLVVSAGELVGFYLPGEDNFSPLTPPVVITIGDSLE